MENNLEKFMEKINIINKDFTTYEDEEKGVIFTLNTINLLARLDYMELDKSQYEVAKFQKKIEDLDYNIINIKRPTSKYEITKKEEDRLTIVDKEVAIRQIWNVSNTAGAFKSFNNKEEAIEYTKYINEKIMEYYK